MGRDTIQLETAMSTISQEYLLEFTSEYGISEDVHPELPGPEERIVDFPEGKVGGLQSQTGNLKTSLKAEADMKKAAETKNADLTKELESLPAFEEFKKYEDDRVEKRYAEMDARLDALSINFDEELYPHMLTAIAGIAKGISEGTPRAERSEVPIMDQLEGLKDAPIEVIMVSLHLESDSGEDAPKWIRDLRPSTSQLKIPVYLEVAGGLSYPWDRFPHHARSDGVPVSVPTIAPQGLAILLADAAT
nr:hypothetical protein [Tanacetum cinerariifolium]